MISSLFPSINIWPWAVLFPSMFLAFFAYETELIVICNVLIILDTNSYKSIVYRLIEGTWLFTIIETVFI